MVLRAKMPASNRNCARQARTSCPQLLTLGGIEPSTTQPFLDAPLRAQGIHRHGRQRLRMLPGAHAAGAVGWARAVGNPTSRRQASFEHSRKGSRGAFQGTASRSILVVPPTCMARDRAGYGECAIALHARFHGSIAATPPKCREKPRHNGFRWVGLISYGDSALAMAIDYGHPFLATADGANFQRAALAHRERR